MNCWQYLMLVNVYLLLFYGFYALLLSRETFFQLNRIYLVSAALLSFFIPLIQSDWVKNLFITQKVQYTLYSSPVLLYRFKPIQDTHFTVGQLMVVIYLAGITLFMARFAFQLFSLSRIINKQQSTAAYSFFKKIKLGDGSNDIIAAHEHAHAREWHSADVLIMEALMIINWFNPVVYLYRFAIKHIHEFIADRQALKTGTTKADYAMLLVSQTFNAPAHRLVNPFFTKSLLKQRILMLQKNRSQQVALFKYFLSAPLFILMLILSSATVNNSKTIRLINKKVQWIFLKPADGTNNAKVITQFKNITLPPESKITLIEKQKTFQASAAADTTYKKDGPVFTAVEQVPEFPGGLSAFSAFLAKNIRYPADARDNNVQGRVVIRFIVETDGALSNFEVVRGIGHGADEEAIRVLALSPNWKPGIQNGRAVRVSYSVPISFALAEDKPENKTGVADVVLSENSKTATDTGKRGGTFIIQGSPTSPLYIVDGKEMEHGDLTVLNPSTIESITVLKDKRATALYGDKGANGVIVIVTKKPVLKLNLAPAKKN